VECGSENGEGGKGDSEWGMRKLEMVEGKRQKTKGAGRRAQGKRRRAHKFWLIEFIWLTG